MSLLREKLRVKQDVGNPQTKLDIIIPVPKEPEVIKLGKITIVDELGDFDITKLNKRLLEKRLTKVANKPATQILVEKESEILPAPAPAPALPAKKRAKKITLKILTGLQEEGVAIETGVQAKQLEEEEKMGEEKEKEKEKEKAADKDEQLEEVVVVKPKAKPRGRRTKAPEKGIAVLSPEDWIDIGSTPIIDRLPEK